MTSMMYLKQSILQLYQTNKNCQETSVINSVIEHNISISKQDSSPGSSYIKLPKELDRPRKGLINIQNTDDNECRKWSISDT